MSNAPSQIQLKLSLSPQLNDLLQAKANNFGIPITQLVKHLIIKEVEKEMYPTFEASDWIQERVKKAIKTESMAVDIEADQVHDFFDKLA